MSAPPLTHHEILELVAPFTRHGRHANLAASDRLARRLVFKPVDHPGDGGAPAIRETLELESRGTGTCVLTRRVEQAGAPPATLTVMGTKPAQMFAQVQAVPPGIHFGRGPGWSLSRSYSLETVGRDPASRCPVMTRGVAQVDGLTLVLGVPATRGVSAEVQLSPAPGEDLELPEDLLAVLGWDWARLIRNAEGWRSRRRLRGGPLARTRAAAAALDAAAAHLAHTLAAAPSRFHGTWAAARWGVFLRRAIPLLTLVGLLAIVAAIPHLFASRKPAILMLAFHVPTLLIALSFCLQELPQYEIPPIPRPLHSAGWRRRAAVDDAASPATPDPRAAVKAV